MSPRRRLTLLILLGLAMTSAVAWPRIWNHLRAGAVLWQFFEGETATGPLAWATHEVVQTEAEWQLGSRSLRVRHYFPRTAAAPPGVLLVHGVHHEAIDEPRLRSFAASLASAGLAVTTPELPELARYRVEPSTIETLRLAATQLASEMGSDRVCMIGISFAGGLGLLAAAEQHEPRPIGCVVTLGAHHDLERLAQYYTGQEVAGPGGQAYPGNPHPYGMLVILHAHLDKFFPATETKTAGRALALHMQGQRSLAQQALDAMDPQHGVRLRNMLQDPHRELAPALLAAVRDHAEQLAEVSPRGKLRQLRVPTFLIHGSDDPVIPSLETRWLAQEVPHEALVSTLITPLLRHAEPDGAPRSRDVLALVRFVADVLETAEIGEPH